MTRKHTELPWCTHESDLGLEIHPLTDNDGLQLIADLPRAECNNAQADAIFIVHAANCHYQLLAALKGCIDQLDRETLGGEALDFARLILRQSSITPA